MSWRILKTIRPFEIAVASDFDAQPAVERELVLRLVSLLWRLRRATAIDTGLLQSPSNIDECSAPESARCENETTATSVVPVGQSASQLDLALNADISRRFLQLDPGSVERLGRYETALRRQVYQVIFVLDYLRRQNLDLKWLPRPSSSVRHFRPLRSIFPKD